MLTRRRDTGFTIVELMVGLAIGLLAVAAAGAIYVSTLQGKRDALRAAKLNQEVRGLIATMGPDIRRAGYWAGAVVAGRATSLPMTSGAAQPYAGNSTSLAIHDDGRCILFAYDADRSGDAAVPAGEVFGFRLSADGGAVEALSPDGATDRTDDCAVGTWTPATSASTVAIDALAFSVAGSHCVNATRGVRWTVTAPGFRGAPCAAAAGDVLVTAGTYVAPQVLDLLTEVRRVTLTITAHHRADPRLAVTAVETVRLPNHRVYRH